MNRTETEQHFDVGGQAVMEGVMMRSPTATAVTVRRPDGTMVTKLTHFVPIGKTDMVLPVVSGDMLFNVLNEYMGFHS